MHLLSASLRITALLFLFLVASSLTAAPARAADDAAWMYDPSVVVKIDLGLSEASIAALAADPYTYVPATFAMSYGDKHYGPSAITLKLKGKQGSFRRLDGKAAFKLKFPSGARPDGLKKMTLNNMVQDNSKVHEAVVYELFRAVGVAAPRTGYATVTVNGASYGLYLNLETMDEVALARWFASTQHLYEGAYGLENDPTDAFNEHYEVDVGDEDDRADLVALMATATDFSAGWYARMAAHADLEQMTRMWATEAYVGHWDGYSGSAVNNYYLHSDAAGVFTMIPWGTDNTLIGRVGFYDGAAQHVIFNGCIADPICHSLYRDALLAVSTTAADLRLGVRAKTIGSGIRSYIEADPRLESSIVVTRKALGSAVRFTNQRRGDFAKWARRLPRGPRFPAADGGAGTIALRWTLAPRRSGITVTGYAVDYRPAGGTWIREVASPSATTLAITGLAAGTYEVRVRTLAGSDASVGPALSVTVGP